MSRSRRAVSLVELLLVVGLLAALLSVFVAWRVNHAATDAGETARAEYYDLRARLEARLADDLRAAVSVAPLGEGRWKILRLVPDPAGGPPSAVETRYELRDAATVLREEAGGVTRWDFRPHLSGRPFIFRLGEPE